MLGSKNLYLGMAVESAPDLPGLPVPGPVFRALPSPAPLAAGANVKLADVEMSARSRKALERLGCTLLGEVAKLTEEQLLACKNFGETSLNEVKQVLGRHGLTLAG